MAFQKYTLSAVLTVLGHTISKRNSSFPCLSLAGTPFTPLANLKMLIAAASSALDREREAAALEENNQSAASDVGSMCEVGSEGDDAGGRKMKSLSVLCKK